MPIIEPVPLDRIHSDARAKFEQAIAEGRLASLRYPAILAYSSTVVSAAAQGYAASRWLITPRLREIIRLRSAQLGGCAECQAARYDESVDDATASCVFTNSSDLSPAERIVMRFVTLMHTDHHAIGAALYRELAQHYSTAEIVEIGVWTGQTLGSHRFIHTLDLLGDDPPALPFDADEIDVARSVQASTENAGR